MLAHAEKAVNDETEVVIDGEGQVLEIVKLPEIEPVVK